MTDDKGVSMTTSAISDERLEEIASWSELAACTKEPGGWCFDTAAALRELQSARSTLRGIAEGTHVIVPKEPTEEMAKAADGFQTHTAYSEQPPRLQLYACVYRAMLAASTGGK